MNQPYSPFNRYNRMLPQKAPLIQPGNGLFGEVNMQAGLDQLGLAFPGAQPEDLQSTLNAQMAQRKQRRAKELAPPEAQPKAQPQEQQYSPF